MHEETSVAIDFQGKCSDTLRMGGGMKHEDPGGDRDPAASHVPPTPRQRQRVGAALKFILVSNKAGHRMLLPMVFLNPSVLQLELGTGRGGAVAAAAGRAPWAPAAGAGRV